MAATDPHSMPQVNEAAEGGEQGRTGRHIGRHRRAAGVRRLPLHRRQHLHRLLPHHGHGCATAPGSLKQPGPAVCHVLPACSGAGPPLCMLLQSSAASPRLPLTQQVLMASSARDRTSDDLLQVTTWSRLLLGTTTSGAQTAVSPPLSLSPHAAYVFTYHPDVDCCCVVVASHYSYISRVLKPLLPTRRGYSQRVVDLAELTAQKWGLIRVTDSPVFLRARTAESV